MAYFSVNGGYKFVCSLNSAAPLADRLLANGPGPGAFTTARDLADLTGSGLIEVARHAWVRIRRRGGHRVRRDLSGLGSKGVAAAMDEEAPHPWTSEERSGGTECVSTGRFRRSPYNEKTNNTTRHRT